METERLRAEMLLMQQRIDNLLAEKEEVVKAFRKIQQQSFSAYHVLQKDRQNAQKKQFNILANEIDSLRAEKSILTDHFGEHTIYEILKKNIDKATGMGLTFQSASDHPNALAFSDMQVTNMFGDVMSQQDAQKPGAAAGSG